MQQKERHHDEATPRAICVRERLKVTDMCKDMT